MRLLGFPGWNITECSGICFDEENNSACAKINEFFERKVNQMDVAPKKLLTGFPKLLEGNVSKRHLMCRCQPVCTECHGEQHGIRKRRRDGFAMEFPKQCVDRRLPPLWRQEPRTQCLPKVKSGVRIYRLEFLRFVTTVV